MPIRDFAHVYNDVNPHILRMIEGTFSLDAAQMCMCGMSGLTNQHHLSNIDSKRNNNRKHLAHHYENMPIQTY